MWLELGMSLDRTYDRLVPNKYYSLLKVDYPKLVVSPRDLSGRLKVTPLDPFDVGKQLDLDIVSPQPSQSAKGPFPTFPSSSVVGAAGTSSPWLDAISCVVLGHTISIKARTLSRRQSHHLA